MAVLGRLKISPNQRLDLPDVVAFDSYSMFDWKSFLGMLVGSKPYIINGFEIFQPHVLIGSPASVVSVEIENSAVLCPDMEESPFFVALPNTPHASVTLIKDDTVSVTNYIEMSIILKSGAEDARALWDPGANGGEGGEFTQVIDTEYYVEALISRNNSGFSEDKIPLSKVVVDYEGNVVSVTDCRSLMYRLGSGGSQPDPLKAFTWQDEPLGYSRQDTPVDMTSALDPNVFRGADKNLKSLKDWMDAVMSRIKEIDGGSKWFQASGSGTSEGNISLSNLFLDSQAGHSILPDREITISWSKSSDGKLRSENAVGKDIAAIWKSNFGQLSWELGGQFNSASNRSYDIHTFEKSIADGESLYLKLDRNISLNGDPDILFTNIDGVTASVVSYGSGAFSGVAVGDFIKKKSGNDFQFYKILELRVSSLIPFSNGTLNGTVADATVQYITISTHDGPISTSSEQYRYFRSRYSNEDLVASIYGFYDTSYQWMGRRNGELFYYRDYGILQPGEEVELLNDSETHEHGGGISDAIFDKAFGSVYSPINGYSLKQTNGTLLTIRRRLSDNTVGTPNDLDNTDALLEYTIAAPIGSMNDDDSLWIRLGNSSGLLTNGDVTDVNLDNVWQVLPPESTPLKSYDNKGVFLIARKTTIGTTECLLFCDGTMLSSDGLWLNNDVCTQRDLYVNEDVYLRNKTKWSVPFIEKDDGLVQENNEQFFWNNESGPDSLGVLGIRNLRISENTTQGKDDISQDVPQDVDFLSNLGTHTAKIGNHTSTIHIPGNLVIDGSTISGSETILQVDDKLITLGVGNDHDGGGGSGIEIADDTKHGTQVRSYSGQSYMDVTFSEVHLYTIGDKFGLNSNVSCGGITAGQMTGEYELVASANTIGQAQSLTPSSIRIYFSGSSATSNETKSLVPEESNIRIYKVPHSIRLGSSNGAYAGVDSWIFKVKHINTAPTLTPVEGYGIVPTANSSNMSAGRIAFVNNDNKGPSGVDTTINFSENLLWDNDTDTFFLTGTFNLSGDLIPGDDDVYNIGSELFRWRSIYLGLEPGSGIYAGNDTNLYRKEANLWKTDDSIEVENNVIVNRSVQLKTHLIPPALPLSERIGIWADEFGMIYQRTSDGDVRLLTNFDGNVYEEVVDIVSAPSGNNQMLPINDGDVITIPKDKRKREGSFLIVSVTSGSPIVTVNKNNNELEDGDIISVRTSVPIGGISANNLSVVEVVVFNCNENTFSYNALSSASSSASGYLENITSTSTRLYRVEEQELEVFLNGQLLSRNRDYEEIGSPGVFSNRIRLLTSIILDDRLTFRVDNNGGKLIIDQRSSTTDLQSAYNAGNEIIISSSLPIELYGPIGEPFLIADGSIKVNGLEFNPQNSNVISLLKSAIWVDDSGNLLYQVGDGTAPINISESGSIGAEIYDHLANTSIHFTQGEISITESQINDFGDYALASDVSSHINNSNIHFTQAQISISKDQIYDLGAIGDISEHILDQNIHFTQGEISITESQINDFGDYALASDLIDLEGEVAAFTSHILDSTIHFTQGEISITESQINDFGDYALASEIAGFADHLANTLIHFTQAEIVIGKNQISDVGDLALASDLSSHSQDNSIHFTQEDITIAKEQISNLEDLALKSDITDVTDHILDNTIHYTREQIGCEWYLGTPDIKSKVLMSTVSGERSWKDFWDDDLLRSSTETGGISFDEYPLVYPPSEDFEIKSITWSPELGILCATGEGTGSWTGYKFMTSDNGGASWQASNPMLEGVFDSICWSPELSHFCAVGSGDVNIAVSLDGNTWLDKSENISDSFNSVCWSPELTLFCAIGDSNVAISSDGDIWSTDSHGLNSPFNSICWSSGLNIFCAVGDTGIATSSDGVAWTETSHSYGTLNSVVWSPTLNRFCAVGDSNIISSTDGTNWTSVDPVVDGAFTSICWASDLGRFIATGSGNVNIAVSQDGINWSDSTQVVGAQYIGCTWSSGLRRLVIIESDKTVLFSTLVTEYMGIISENGKDITILNNLTIQGTINGREFTDLALNQDLQTHTNNDSIHFQAAYTETFAIEDWEGPSAGFYTITFAHNLSENMVQVEVWDSASDQIDVERLLTSANETQLRVPSDPDLRFSGIFIIKRA